MSRLSIQWQPCLVPLCFKSLNRIPLAFPKISSVMQPWQYGFVILRAEYNAVYRVRDQFIACYLVWEQGIAWKCIPLRKAVQEPFCVILNGICSSSRVNNHIDNHAPFPVCEFGLHPNFSWKFRFSAYLRLPFAKMQRTYCRTLHLL